MLGILLLAAAVVSPAAPSGPARLTLKNGIVYRLREPPRFSGGRIVFQTVDGKVFSIAESEVATIGSAPPPTATPKYSSQDSRALGAIARQQRKGRPAEVAPGRPVRKKKTSRRDRQPTPTRLPD